MVGTVSGQWVNCLDAVGKQLGEFCALPCHFESVGFFLRRCGGNMEITQVYRSCLTNSLKVMQRCRYTAVWS